MNVTKTICYCALLLMLREMPTSDTRRFLWRNPDIILAPSFTSNHPRAVYFTVIYREGYVSNKLFLTITETMITK
jgi:hypothetical protein